MQCFSPFAVGSQILQPETEAVTRLCNVDEAVWVGYGHMLGVLTEVFGRRRLVGGEGGCVLWVWEGKQAKWRGDVIKNS